jgi:Zn-dependent protease
MFSGETIRRILPLIPILLLSLTVHEYAHGYVASKLGDDTAKSMGRLSLNPLVHIDILGALVLLLTGLVGWAKPIPVNPYRLRNRNRDMVLVSLAGPLSNFCLMLVFILLARASVYFSQQIFSLVGSERLVSSIFKFLLTCGAVNLGLAAFNLLPVPPLDGYRVVGAILPESVDAFCRRFQLVFFIVLLIALQRGFFSGVMMFLYENVFFRLLS